MPLSRRQKVWLSAGVLIPAVAAAGFALAGRSHPPIHGTADTEEVESRPMDDRIPVKTVRPKHDSRFRVSVRQLATVVPFYEADLRTRAAGVVRAVHKNIGDHVLQGELLVELDVPDLEQEVLQKEAVVEQRRRERAAAEAQVKSARAAVEVARANVQQKQTDVRQATAARLYRERRLARFKQLAGRQAITPDVVDEQEQAAQAAQAAEESAQVAVRKAGADLAEKEASLEAALADVSLKEALVAVAEKDRDRSRALADYARISAPFDGVVTRRNVDPGDFVQNATSGGGTALLSLARTDLVTVVVKLPDNAAPFVTPATTAEIVMDDLPGVTLHARVTRFSRAIEPDDRTMRVELDLFNGTAADYYRLVGRVAAASLAPLGAADPCAAVAAALAGAGATRHDHKSAADALPACPVPVAGRPLLPGMTGYARLYLDEFAGTPLVPSSAVYTRGGKAYVLVVRDGRTVELPVKVQVNDGRLAKVALVTRDADPSTGAREVLHDWIGSEEVVVSRQLEVGPGQAVRTTREEW